MGQVADGQKFQNLVRLGTQGAFLIGDALAAKPCVPQLFTILSARNHHQVFLNSHRAKLMRDLEGSQQALVEQFVRRQTRDVFAVHGDAARRWFKNARDHVEKSGFSRTIGSNQAGNRTFFDFQTCPIYRVKTPKMFVKVVNDYHVIP